MLLPMLACGQNWAVWHWGPNTNGIATNFPARAEDIGSSNTWPGASAVLTWEELRAARLCMSHMTNTPAQAPAPSGAVNVIRKPSDQAFGTAVADVADLSFPVAANTDYAFEFYVIVT